MPPAELTLEIETRVSGFGFWLAARLARLGLYRLAGCVTIMRIRVPPGQWQTLKLRDALECRPSAPVRI